MQSLQGIDEVNLFREDDQVIHFSNPKLQAAIQANTYVVSGNASTKTIEELMPDILPQLGHEKMQQLAARMQGIQGLMGGLGRQAGGAAAPAAGAADDDDDVPALVGTNFEAAAAAGEKKKSNVEEQD